jgi:hypothetical protein
LVELQFIGKLTVKGMSHRSPLLSRVRGNTQKERRKAHFLREVVQKGVVSVVSVVSVVRYYYLRTVQLDGKNEDIQTAVRRGPDMTRGKIVVPRVLVPHTSDSVQGVDQK